MSRSRMLTRAKRLFARTRWVLLAYYCLLIAVLNLKGEPQDPCPMIIGDLNFDSTRVPYTRHRTDHFTIVWNPDNGGALSISPNGRPHKVLWSSVTGKSFVTAATGKEIVTEARGSFVFEDELESVCVNQSIERVVSEGQRFEITGNLLCGAAQRLTGYAISFVEVAPNQIRFSLEISDPEYNRVYLTYASNADEHFFGFGEQFTYFDLKGRRLPIFVSEQGVGRGLQPLTSLLDQFGNAGGTWYTSYAVAPHYITSQLRSLFLENYEYAIFDMRRDDLVQIQLYSNRMSGRILSGESPAQLIQEYTGVVGRMRPLPDWILEGAIVGVQGGTERVRDIYSQLLAADVPIVAFWLQDWVGQRVTLGGIGRQLWWNWELNSTRYPEWERLRTDLERDDVRLMVYVNPFLVDVPADSGHRRNLFKEAQELGYLVRNSEGRPYLVQNTDFSAGMVDLSNPAAYDWMKGILHEQVLGIGASGWMADFGEALPYDAQLSTNTLASEYHNRYPEVWARLNREVVEESPHADEVVFFSRSGYRESPRYSTLFWLGDQLVSWDSYDGIKTAVTGLLSSGLSGYSFNHSDIGGYSNISLPLIRYYRSKELLFRWMELNAFTTVYRTHEGFLPEANHQFYSDQETIEQFGRFARIYAAWSFYRSELVEEASETGLPVVRHPFIHYPDDPHFYGMSYQEFLVGTELLVAPVLDPEVTEKQVYLPEGRWVHVWTGDTFGAPETGTTITIPAPIGEPPVFYKEGSEVGIQFVDNLENAGLMSR